MSSPETDVAETPTDELRQAVLAELTDELGDGLVGSYVRPGDDLWLRVTDVPEVQAVKVARIDVA